MVKAKIPSANAKNDWRAERSSEVSELLRAKIIKAARNCLETTDYAKLRMEMVAREAGCSRGTLYRYFSSKEEILLSIAIANYQRIAAKVESEIATISDPRLQFATGLARAMALSLSDDQLNALSMDMVNRAMTTDAEALQQVIAESLAPYMEAAARQGLQRDGVELADATQWIIQASNGLLNTGWPVVAGKTLTPKRQVAYLCRYLLFPIFDMEGIV